MLKNPEYYYAKNSLSEYLLYDEISCLEGTLLICDIDPRRTWLPPHLTGAEHALPRDPHGFYDSDYFEKHDEIYDAALRLTLLSEHPAFNLPIDDERPLSVVLDYEQKRLESLSFKLIEDDGFPAEIDRGTLKRQILNRKKAMQQFLSVRRIFLSMPGVDETSRFPPKFYTEWAAKKGVKIPWLAWAQTEGLIGSSGTGAESELFSPEGDMGARKEKTYQLHIGVLVQLLMEVGNRTGVVNQNTLKTQGAIIGEIHRLFGKHHGLSESTLKKHQQFGNQVMTEKGIKLQVQKR